MERIVSLAIAVLLGVLFIGCSRMENTLEDDKTAVAGTRQNKGESESMEPGMNTKVIGCDWHIRIDEQIPWRMGDSEFKATFQFSAQKTGGIDPRGDWNGKAVMILNGDAKVVLQSGEVAGTIDGIGKDDNVSFVLDDCSEPVKVAPPSDFISVVPLTAPDYYTAGQYLNFNAAKDVDILFPDSVRFEDAQPFTGKRYIHIKVIGLAVTAQIEGIGSFTGICEGIPVTPAGTLGN